MLGILFTAVGSFFGEIFAVIGKKEVDKKEESMNIMGFLLLFWGTLFFAIIILYKGSFDFSLESLPTFLPRLVLELIILNVALKALIVSDRSTFGFVRTITLPLLIVVDLFLGYTISPVQMVGIGVIILTLFILFMNHGINTRGLKLVIWSAIIPVATISLFKYNITNFNAVEAEQFLVHVFLLIYFFFASLKTDGQNPFKCIFKPIFLKQSLAEGAGTVVMSFAYLFAPASVITSAKRSFSVLWSVLSGNKVFHESHIILKISMVILLALGIILLVL
jgi:hypothetical protein